MRSWVVRGQEQKGAALVLALLFMMLGGLVVGGLLSFVDASIISHGRALDRIESKYTADAGIEWFASDLLTDASLDRYDGDDVDIDLWPGGTLNQVTPQVRIDVINVINPGTTKEYTLTSNAGNASITATLLQRDSAGTIEIEVSTWTISYE
ncbi:MAG: hypothetical protein SVY53_07410 [Chloroflexota bacterium]|nr:hypothetical protein [Chloroflexota bacterium]